MKRGHGSERDAIADLEYQRLVHETASAVLVNLDENDHWLPFSQIEIDRDAKVVTLPEWLAIEKGLV